MRECVECLNSVHDDRAVVCPSCGATLASANAGREAKSPPSNGAATPLDEEQVRFRRQFEERAIQLPEEALRRAESLLSSAESELRRATVLLVDLCGFTREGQRRSAEDLSLLATGFYKVCADCVIRRGGFVVKFLGDAVLSVFGAPVAFDRDTESAIQAALDIRDYFVQSAPGAAAPSGARPLQVSIGVATGAIRSGMIDGPSGKTYDVLGDTVNLASRLQHAAGPNEILVCPATRGAVDRWFECEPTAPLSLKNIEEQVVAFKVIDRKSDRLPRRQFDTSFCGREKELAALTACLSGSSDGGAVRVAHIAGEAGMGKSRLVDEALKRVDAASPSAPCRAIWWTAEPASSMILLWPALEWLREELGLAPHDAPEAIQRAAERYLHERFPAEDADPLLIEYVLGVPRAIEALHGIPPERIQRNLFALLRMLVLGGEHRRTGTSTDLGGSANGPTVLIADDLQWVDPLTLQFLRSLIDWPGHSARQPLPSAANSNRHLPSATPPLRVVCIYRSGATPPMPAGPGDLRIALQPMTEQERRSLLSRLVPTEDFLPEIRRLVLDRAAGNPLFIEEMSRLVEGVMRNNAELNGEALRNHIIQVIPVSLQDLIQSRIDRLDSRSRQVLCCGALLGIEFTFSLIELFDIVREGLSDHLHALRAMRILGEQPTPRDVRYYFTHGLFRDVAYATMLEEQKRALHVSLARRLEETFAGRIQEYYELLAYHFSRGGESQKAVYYLVKAADRQSMFGEAAMALENFSEATELLSGLPPTPARQVLMARILTRCGRLHRDLGDGEQSDETLAAALECATALQNERLALEARLERAISEVWRGNHEAAEGALEPLAQEARRLQCPIAESVALNSLGVARWQRGELEAALQAFRSLATLAEQHGAPQVQADAFNNAGLIYWRWGQHAQALKAFKRALPLRRQADDMFGLCATLMNAGIVQEQLGEVGAARRSYLNARRLAEKTGHIQALAALESNLSNLERRVGTTTTALEHAARAVDYSRQADDPHLETIALENAGLACAARGEFDTARERYYQGLAIAKDKKYAEKQCSIRLNLVRLAFEQRAFGTGDIQRVNDLIADVEKLAAPDLASQAYRLKGQLLDALDERNARTAGEYLEIARDRAGAAGDFFEELDSWRALRAFHDAHGATEETARCSAKIGEMMDILSRSMPRSNGAAN